MIGEEELSNYEVVGGLDFIKFIQTWLEQQPESVMFLFLGLGLFSFLQLFLILPSVLNSTRKRKHQFENTKLGEESIEANRGWVKILRI